MRIFWPVLFRIVVVVILIGTSLNPTSSAKAGGGSEPNFLQYSVAFEQLMSIADLNPRSITGGETTYTSMASSVNFSFSVRDRFMDGPGFNMESWSVTSSYTPAPQYPRRDDQNFRLFDYHLAGVNEWFLRVFYNNQVCSQGPIVRFSAIDTSGTWFELHNSSPVTLTMSVTGRDRPYEVIGSLPPHAVGKNGLKRIFDDKSLLVYIRDDANQVCAGAQWYWDKLPFQFSVSPAVTATPTPTRTTTPRPYSGRGVFVPISGR